MIWVTGTLSLESGFDGYMWRLGGKEVGCSIWSTSFDGLTVVEEINLMNYRSQTDLGLGGN